MHFMYMYIHAHVNIRRVKREIYSQQRIENCPVKFA